jgi:hypothetical protein
MPYATLNLKMISFNDSEALHCISIVQLADFCYRKILYLNTNAKEDVAYKGVLTIGK